MIHLHLKEVNGSSQQLTTSVWTVNLISIILIVPSVLLFAMDSKTLPHAELKSQKTQRRKLDALEKKLQHHFEIKKMNEALRLNAVEIYKKRVDNHNNFTK